MKKGIYIFLAIVVVVVFIGYAVVQDSFNKVEEVSSGQLTTYSSPTLGLEFLYRAGSDGYVVDEALFSSIHPDFIQTLTLILQKEKEEVEQSSVAREWPPVITVSIFENKKNVQAAAWALANGTQSNIEAKVGDIVDYALNGVQGIRYASDGLYRADTIIVRHDGRIYVISGMYLDENSPIRRDFDAFVDSIRFIASID